MWPGRLDRIKIWVKPVREVQVGSGSEDQIPLVSQDLDNFSFRHRVSRLVQLLKHHAMINYLISLLFIIDIVHRNPTNSQEYKGADAQPDIMILGNPYAIMASRYV